jgi:hypothetical protein
VHGLPFFIDRDSGFFGSTKRQWLLRQTSGDLAFDAQVLLMRADLHGRLFDSRREALSALEDALGLELAILGVRHPLGQVARDAGLPVSDIAYEEALRRAAEMSRRFEERNEPADRSPGRPILVALAAELAAPQGLSARLAEQLA